MMLLFKISIHLSVETLIVHAGLTPNTLQQLAWYFYLITGSIQFDCFDRSIYSQCTVMRDVMLNYNCQEYDCSMESLPLLSNE